MLMFKLAVRNMFRSLRRTLLTMITVIVGILSLVAAYGMVHGIQDGMTQSEIKTNMGHLRVLRKGYLKEEDSFPLDIVVSNPQKVVSTITQKWPKANAFTRIIFDAKVSDGTYGSNVRGMVVPIEKAAKAFAYLRNKAGETMPGQGNQILIGANLAKVFKKKVGDTITVEARTQTGSLNAVDFKIYGIFKVDNLLIEAFTIFIADGPGRKLLQMPKDATDVIAVLENRSDTQAVANAVAAATPKNLPYTWIDKDKEMAQINDIRTKMFNFLIAVIMLLAAAGMINTMMMAGYERRGEIGMMMAMGLQRGKVIALFALEGGFIGLLGSVIGAAFGSAISLYFQAYGLSVATKSDAMTTSATGMSMPSTFYFQWRPETVLIGLLLGVAVSVLAAVWPASRITKQEPKDILAGS